ncbi:hypothetical protein NDU88_002864 [Pleurodeles waltl]|uniref:Uncharacterized protein n=1 Tax=Pleurodeles waltl TaxID=8319 RepID=A0AAV7QA30_PLEWA|nr:hypothetical protein NDU88_002864 [Pleurodeles waltl]
MALPPHEDTPPLASEPWIPEGHRAVLRITVNLNGFLGASTARQQLIVGRVHQCFISSCVLQRAHTSALFSYFIGFQRIWVHTLDLTLE